MIRAAKTTGGGTAEATWAPDQSQRKRIRTTNRDFYQDYYRARPHLSLRYDYIYRKRLLRAFLKENKISVSQKKCLTSDLEMALCYFPLSAIASCTGSRYRVPPLTWPGEKRGVEVMMNTAFASMIYTTLCLTLAGLLIWLFAHMYWSTSRTTAPCFRTSIVF